MSLDESSTGLLNVRQVASRLGVAPRRVYVLVERGELSGYKLGRNLRFHLSDIESFLEGRRINETPSRGGER